LSDFVPVILPTYTTYEDGTECSETSAHKIQTPGNHPKARLQHKLFYLQNENCAIFYYVGF